jgi:hypothetical protein
MLDNLSKKQTKNQNGRWGTKLRFSRNWTKIIDLDIMKN